jgi:hypothetical protein
MSFHQDMILDKKLGTNKMADIAECSKRLCYDLQRNSDPGRVYGGTTGKPVWEPWSPRTALGPKTEQGRRSRRPKSQVAPKTPAFRNGIGPGNGKTSGTIT